MNSSRRKPPLGPAPWLPPRAYCADHQGDCFAGGMCSNCVPVGGPHVYVLADAPLSALRALHIAHGEGRT